MRIHRKTSLLTVVAALLLWMGSALPAMGQMVQQTIELKPGWNAVFLELDPGSLACADVFADVPGLLSAWTWNPRVSNVEYIQDPDTLVPDQAQWLVYFPDSAVATNLHAIYGERAYLIHLGGTQAVEWTVSGQPRLPSINWRPDSFNLVGFHLQPGNEPLFGDFFSSSAAHAGQEIYFLNDQGTWEQVTDPATNRMRSGEAVWVYTKGQSEFAGPLSVQLDQRSGLHYGNLLSEQTLRLKNHSAADAPVTVTTGGATPLSHRVFNPDAGDVGWRDFPLTLSVAAGEQVAVRVGVSRIGLTPSVVYEGTLAITDGSGMRVVVPTSVEGISYAGLWVGEVSAAKVSEPRVAPDQDFPLQSDERSYETSSAFSFPLILHIDAAGQVRLLKQVIQAWDETEGRYVLLTDDAKVSQFSTSLNGKAVARRISSAAFGELSPAEPRYEAPMTGQVGEIGGSLACTVVVRPDDPSNPFRHRYHPDHKDSAQAYEVTRAIELTFGDQDADGQSIAGASALGWGAAGTGGIYRETLTGLHRSPIRVEGTFLLQKVNDIATLE